MLATRSVDRRGPTAAGRMRLASSVLLRKPATDSTSFDLIAASIVIGCCVVQAVKTATATIPRSLGNGCMRHPYRRCRLGYSGIRIHSLVLIFAKEGDRIIIVMELKLPLSTNGNHLKKLSSIAQNNRLSSSPSKFVLCAFDNCSVDQESVSFASKFSLPFSKNPVSSLGFGVRLNADFITPWNSLHS